MHPPPDSFQADSRNRRRNGSRSRFLQAQLRTHARSKPAGPAAQFWQIFAGSWRKPLFALYECSKSARRDAPTRPTRERHRAFNGGNDGVKRAMRFQVPASAGRPYKRYLTLFRWYPNRMGAHNVDLISDPHHLRNGALGRGCPRRVVVRWGFRYMSAPEFVRWGSDPSMRECHQGAKCWARPKALQRRHQAPAQTRPLRICCSP